MLSNKIGRSIKELRSPLNLTQDDLVKKADIKYTALIHVESGVIKKPNVQMMAKIAKNLNVAIEKLLS